MFVYDLVEIFINENHSVELSDQPTTGFNGSFPNPGSVTLGSDFGPCHPNSRWSPTEKHGQSTGKGKLVAGSPKTSVAQKIRGVS